MAHSKPSTLPQLLLDRTYDSKAEIGFLDINGKVIRTFSHQSLFKTAQDDARRLLASGLKGNSKDVVVTEFEDHQSHIRVFWACCLAGIPFCPLPPLHPDRSARRAAFAHINALLDGPTLITDEKTMLSVNQILPEMKAITLSDLDRISLDTAQYDADVFPQRRANPDDIACLMLTSGSTGNSKAVALRHSNILSSIRGKIKHHDTTSSSRFFNWIALHHVACFTEIHFQALEADASQYHVSSMAIVQRPINLLEWCSNLRITYTFSPNFLVAQLCRDVSGARSSLKAVDLSHLEIFISGGEAVPVKTAVEFADILGDCGAPRDALRAGFGMTETGAGCIYDRRAILQDPELYETKYLSLGTCCEGTLVRTVDPKSGKTCGPSKIGQLQLSGPTVFREYYNNAAATEKSFTEDGWFITGDQAVIDTEGNLHMVGRDTDYVNINGVKHPSVDVEHYIEDSNIDGLVRSFVFVCPLRLPNADTETYCVFYLHTLATEDELPEDHIRSMAATNQSIKRACSVFCSLAPHAILPLPGKSFVKTALGKVSRTALAKVYLEGKFASFEAQLRTSSDAAPPVNGAVNGKPVNTVEDTVYAILSKLFGLSTSDLRRSQNIFDTGASSMQFMQLKHLLQESFAIPELQMIELLKRPEIGSLCAYIEQLHSRGDTLPVESAYDPIVCLHSRGSKPPLFLIHPFHGEILGFMDLAQALDDDRKVYAVRARGFNHGEPLFSSFEEMVSVYTASVEACYPSGPFFLVGYSLGGVIAFEVAKSLEKRGKEVAWVGALDVVPRIGPLMEEMSWLQTTLTLCAFLDLVPSSALGDLRDDLRTRFPDADTGGPEPASAEDIIGWLLDHCDKKRFSELHLDKVEFVRWLHIAYTLVRSARPYEPSGTLNGASLTVFRTAGTNNSAAHPRQANESLDDWKEFCGGRFEVVNVKGEHHTLLSKENISAFAELTRTAMLSAEYLPRE